MGIATEVYRSLRYTGADCTHDVVLRAGRPSCSNADQGAENAAQAFTDGTLAHLRAWFETWRLPSLCGADHDCSILGEIEDWNLIEGPGFRWVEYEGKTVYFLTDAGADGELRDG